MRILITEDEKQLAGQIAKALSADGHLPVVAPDGETALRMAQEEEFDLMILDVGLPGRDGFEVLQQFRAEHRPCRVLMVTARGELDDRVRGLSLGADDYLAKPFAIRELLARVQALGRRYPAEPTDALRVGDLTMHLSDREVHRGDRKIALSTREFDLLKVLLHEPGRVFTRMELCERVWEREHEYDTKLVEVYVGRLRRKVDEPPAVPLIQTVRHVGYVLREPAKG